MRFLIRWINNRLLKQRDSAREAGDKLALAIYKSKDKSLWPALVAYCKAEGWGGPAMSWIIKFHTHEECVLCGDSISFFRIDRAELCKSCKVHPKL